MSTTSTISREEIQAANKRFVAATAAKDTNALAQAYTDDGVVLPPGGELVSGRASIERFWRQTIDSMGVKAVKLETLQVEPHGDVTIEIGHYTITGADFGEIDHGKYMAVWRKQHGTLKIRADIWNSSKPQP